MKIRRKSNHCLNCDSLLDSVYNYCPMCGQENNDNNVSLTTLLQDFFSNYFSFDSRFGKSFKPFLFKPGFLTNMFIEGKRMSYAHPLRLYLIISLFYFFVCSLIVKDMLKDADRQIVEANANLKNMTFLSPEDRSQLKEALSAGQMEKIQQNLDGNNISELSDAINTSLDTEEKKKLFTSLSAQILDSLKLDTTASAKKVIPLTPGDKGIATSVSVDTSSGVFIFQKFSEIYDLSKDELLTEDEIIDSVAQGQPLNRTQRYAASQGIRIMRADKAQVGTYVVKNLPIMMLILIPVFAGILKLLYIRRDKLYIHHVIHGLHLHSFAYLIYGLTLIITYFYIPSDSVSVLINTLIFILVSTYTFISFLRVYRQHWFKTLVKFNLAGFIYLNIIIMFFFLEIAISVLMY